MSQKSDNGFGFWGNPFLTPVLIGLWLALLVDFRHHPEWDMAVATYFYDPNLCAANLSNCLGFPVAHNPLASFLRESLHKAPVYIGLFLLIWVITRAVTKAKWDTAGAKNLIVVTTSLVVGPLLIVNVFFKEVFGRPRPRMIEQFGSSMDFTLPGDIIGQCVSNCSFVSGEASAGGWLLCLGLLFAPNMRRYAYPVLFIVGAFMTLLRVAFGAHFISDVLLGYISSVIVCAIIVQIIIQIEKTRSKSAH